MKNDKNTQIISIIAIVAVVGVSALAISQNNDTKNMSSDMMGSSNSEMMIQANRASADYKMMAEMNGEEYDKLFLANMIAHHQGAVDMASLASKNAKHQEVKDLANDIVSAQTTEIASMVAWQKAWGYPESSGDEMMDHSAMGMRDSNTGMMSALSNKTGEEFDKAFLEQMILHHQSAIDMAASGSNAQHQEVKDLTKAITAAQTNEIKMMKQWQKDWGYSS